MLNNEKTPAGECISRVVDAVLAQESDNVERLVDNNGDSRTHADG